MKIRNGYVSNSSSSSFIIRGMKIEKDVMIEKLNISLEDEGVDIEDEWEVMELLQSKFEGFSFEPTGNAFEGREWDTFIVGKSLGSLEDGEAIELKDMTPEENEEILNKFKKLGFDGELKTFIEMLSTDNI